MHAAAQERTSRPGKSAKSSFAANTLADGVSSSESVIQPRQPLRRHSHDSFGAVHFPLSTFLILPFPPLHRASACSLVHPKIVEQLATKEAATARRWRPLRAGQARVTLGGDDCNSQTVRAQLSAMPILKRQSGLQTLYQHDNRRRPAVVHDILYTLYRLVAYHDCISLLSDISPSIDRSVIPTC